MNRIQCEQLFAAYLLDELDASTRAEIETALETDAVLRERLGDMRMALKLLHRSFDEEAQPRLSDDRRAALLRTAAAAAPATLRPRGEMSRWRKGLLISMAAVAATVLLTLGLASLTGYSPGGLGVQRSLELALQSRPQPDETGDTEAPMARPADPTDEENYRERENDRKQSATTPNPIIPMDTGLPSGEWSQLESEGEGRRPRQISPGNSRTRRGSIGGMVTYDDEERAKNTTSVTDLPPRTSFKSLADHAPESQVTAGGYVTSLAEEGGKLREGNAKGKSPGMGRTAGDSDGSSTMTTPTVENSGRLITRGLDGLDFAPGIHDKLETRKFTSPRSVPPGEMSGVTAGLRADEAAKPGGRRNLGISAANKTLEDKKDGLSSGVRYENRMAKPAPPSGPSEKWEDHSGYYARKGVKLGSERPLPAASSFRQVPVNPWVMTHRDRFSTFALDVDRASYSLCHAYLEAGQLPPAGAVRMEEFINTVDCNYPRRPSGVFNIFAEGAADPFSAPGEDTTILKIGVQGRVIGREGRKSAHLVFVVDTSGSMARPDRLPLIQKSLKMLADALGPDDTVSLVAYSRKAELLIEHVPASRKSDIMAGFDKLRAGGPTNLLAGLEAGYSLARREFVAGRINRVILCSDGVANIGQSDSQIILDHVAAYRRHGITLTVAGFGRGGYNDELLETLAKQGDGNYLFIDSMQQAREAFVENMNATLQTIALDARIQVEFNPARVRRYRLIGYEKRQIADEDFRNDTIDAAEVGSGQSATALYELELIGPERDRQAGVLGAVYVRYRNADTRQIEEVSHRLDARVVRAMSVEEAPRFYLAAGAAHFAEILRESPYAKNGNLEQVSRVIQHVSAALPLDNQAKELLWMVERARDLKRSR